MATWLRVDNDEELIAFNRECVSVAKTNGNTLKIWVNSIRTPFEIKYENKEKVKEAYDIIVKGAT